MHEIGHCESPWAQGMMEGSLLLACFLSRGGSNAAVAIAWPPPWIWPCGPRPTVPLARLPRRARGASRASLGSVRRCRAHSLWDRHARPWAEGFRLGPSTQQCPPPTPDRASSPLLLPLNACLTSSPRLTQLVCCASAGALRAGPAAAARLSLCCCALVQRQGARPRCLSGCMRAGARCSCTPATLSEPTLAPVPTFFASTIRFQTSRS